MAGNREAYQAALRAGQTLTREQNWAGAANEFRRAIAEFPNDRNARIGLAMSLFRQGGLMQSLAELEYVQQLAPDDQRVTLKIQEIQTILAEEAKAKPPTSPIVMEPPRPVAPPPTPTPAPPPSAPAPPRRGHDDMLAALAGRRGRQEEPAGRPTLVAQDQSDDLTYPVSAVCDASTSQERVDAFLSLIGAVTRAPNSGDSGARTMPRVDAAVRVAILDLARTRANLPLGPTGDVVYSPLRGDKPDLPMPELESMTDDTQLRAALALARTRIWLDDRRFDAAVDECEAAIEAAPTLLPLHLRLAEAFQAQGKTSAAWALFNSTADVYLVRDMPERAVEALRAAVRVGPDVSLRQRLANMLLERGQSDAALAEHLALCDQYLAIGQSDRAIEEFRRVIATFPDNAEALVGFGRALHRLGRISEASEIFARAWLMAPDHPVAGVFFVITHANLDWLQLKGAFESLVEIARQRDPRLFGAIRPLADAAELYPENAGLNCIAGALLVETGQPERAIELLEHAIKAGGDVAPEAEPWLARAVMLAGKPAETVKVTSLEGIEMDDLVSVASHADTLMDFGHWVRAEPFVARLVTANPLGDYRWRLAVVYAHLGRFDAALDAIDLAEAEDTNPALMAAVAEITELAIKASEGWIGLERLAHWRQLRNEPRLAAQAMVAAADARMAAGLVDDAIATLRQAIEVVRGRDMEFALHLRERIVQVAPNDVPARQSLISAYMNMGRASEAMQVANSSAAIARDAGDWASVVAMLRQVIQFDPWDREAQFNLGDALVHLGERDEAKRIFDRLIRQDPSHTRAQEHLRRLQGAAGS